MQRCILSDVPHFSFIAFFYIYIHLVIMAGWMCVLIDTCLYIRFLNTLCLICRLQTKTGEKKWTFYCSWIIIESTSCCSRDLTTKKKRKKLSPLLTDSEKSICVVLLRCHNVCVWPFAKKRMRKETAWASGSVRAVWLLSNSPQGTKAA